MMEVARKSPIFRGTACPVSQSSSCKKGSVRLLVVLLALAAFLTTAHAQDPVHAFPKNYSIALQNSAVAVIRVHYGPHEKIGVHDHSQSPTVYVYLSDSGPVRFQHLEEEPFALIRPPTVKGAFRVSPGRVERHTVENLGDASSDFLRVELKQVPLGGVKPFRGEAPPALSSNRDTVELRTPALAIERIVCAGAAPCAVKPSPASSVIVAFTPLFLQAGGSGTQQAPLEAGAVRWLPASAPVSIQPAAGSSAHLLRILLPATRRN